MADRHRSETRSAATGVSETGSLSPGSKFAGHTIEGVLGRGGMGVVYRARHEALDRLCALKVISVELSRDTTLRERFKQEARTAASIEHPNIVPVLDAGENEGTPYLSMRLIEGVDLQTRLAESGQLDPRAGAAIARQIASALDAAHEAGLVHRDVKPGNILLNQAPAGDQAYLSDFGISKLLGAGSASSATTRGHFLGTLDYMAPEQGMGEPVDRRADIYALACVLFHSLGGAAPFARDTPLATLFAQANAPRPMVSELRPDLPRELDAVLFKAMSVDPDDRYDTAGEFVEAADQALAGTLEEVPAFSDRPRRSRRLAVALFVAALILAAVITLVALEGGLPETNSGSKTAASVTVGSITATIPVSPRPTDITVGSPNIWTVNGAGRRADAIDPATNKLADEPISLQDSADAIVVGFNSVWVTDAHSGSLLRLDAGERRVTRQISVGAGPADVAIDGRWLWVANAGGHSLSRVDPTPGAADRTVPLSGTPLDVETGDGGTWVLLGDGTLAKVNPETASVFKTRRLGDSGLTALAVSPHSIWVLDPRAGRLRRYDPSTLKPMGRPIKVGEDPRDIAFGFGSIWIADGAGREVERVDASTGRASGKPIELGTSPDAVATGRGSVWVASRNGSKVTRIEPVIASQ